PPPSLHDALPTYPADIDPFGPSIFQRPCCLAKLSRHAQRPAKVTARSGREDAEFAIRLRGNDPIGDLVDRAVSSARNDKSSSLDRRSFGQLDPVARAFCERHLKRAEVCPQVARDRGPIAPRR